MQAMRARFAHSEITLLVRPWVAGLFSSAPYIDKLWTEEKPLNAQDWFRMTREIRSRRFDMAILLPNSFESALMMFAGGVRQRVGYATDARRWMLTTAVRKGSEPRHQ